MAELVGIREVAKFLGMESRVPKREGNRIWEAIRKGLDIPHVRLGRRYLFDLEAVNRWLQARMTNRPR